MIFFFADFGDFAISCFWPSAGAWGAVLGEASGRGAVLGLGPKMTILELFGPRAGKLLRKVGVFDTFLSCFFRKKQRKNRPRFFARFENGGEKRILAVIGFF